MSTITTVVFDLGGVLVDWNPRYLYRKLLPDEAAVEQFLARVCTPSWNKQMDAGKPWAEGVAELVAVHPEQADLIRAFDERWDEMLGGPIEGAVAIHAELRAAGVPLYALSNWSSDKFALAEQRYPFLSQFDGRVISGRVGLVKPNARIFRHLIEQHHLDPTATVFVDDLRENLDAAEALGMVGVLYTTPEQLRADLAEHGLVTAGE